MTPNEIHQLIEEIDRSLPERMIGNEANSIIAKRIQSLAVTDRKNLIEALRKDLSFRIPPYKRAREHVLSEARLSSALAIAKILQLHELKSDIESLLKDVREEKALRLVHAPTIERYLESFNKMTPKVSVSHAMV